MLSQKHVGFFVKSRLVLFSFNWNRNIPAQFIKNLECEISWNLLGRESRCFMLRDRETDGRTDVMRLIVIFRNGVENAPKTPSRSKIPNVFVNE